MKYVNVPPQEVSISDIDGAKKVTLESASFIKKKRRIVMTQCKIDEEGELKNHALSLCQYLISNNESRTEVDFKHIESLIEDDFINLDEFILKV